MTFELKLPRVNQYMTGATIECVYATCDTRLKAGSKLVDISVDLGDAFAQECPPITYYRLVLRESLWLRDLAAVPGRLFGMDETLALFTATQDEAIGGAPARAVRIATAAIVHHPLMWSGSASNNP